MSRVWDGGSWEGISYPPPLQQRRSHPATTHTNCSRAAWLERERVQQTSVYPPLLSQPLPALPLNPTPLLFLSSQQKDFQVSPPVRTCTQSLASLSQSSLCTFLTFHFSLCVFPPSLLPLLLCAPLLSRMCRSSFSPSSPHPAPPPSLGWASLAVVSHSHSCLKQSTASAFPIFTFRQHNT